MTSPLVELFLDAVRVDSRSLKERPMAEFVARRLAGLPIDIYEDDAAPHFGGECGNLICVPRNIDFSRPVIALLAHMDTPRSTAHVLPVMKDSRIESDGTMALGVDNRAGTSVLLHVLRKYSASNAAGNFIVVFTVAEEIGPYGSRYLDLSPYNVKMCFVFDCSRRPGTFIRAAVGCSLYNARFVGTASHAAVSPEKGVNAIRIAAKALTQVPVGRLSSTMTSNIGIISGGTATNVVPDECIVQGEVREFDPALITQHISDVEKTFRFTAIESGGNVDFTSSIDFAPFALQDSDDVVRTTTEVLEQLGLAPEPIHYLGGSDANTLNAKGIPSVNLGIGAQNPHGNDEFILIDDLHMSAEIAQKLIERSATLL